MSNGERDRRFYRTREAVILAALMALAVVFFLAVTGLSHLYRAQQESLGRRWFARGVRDLKERRYPPAVSGFQTALLYAPDNESYQLNLAEALIGLGRGSEASAYLANLWEREPENGLVNLELARMAVQKGQTGKALRFYHNAIYATWFPDQTGDQSADPEAKRREVRVELVRFLLAIGDRTQAQSELIALAANLGDDPAQHRLAGELFFEARDYEHALAEYGVSLKAEPRDPAVLAGAGRAAFELGRYTPAERDLQDALQANPSDEKVAQELQETKMVVQMDPLQRHLPSAQRNAMVMEDFAIAWGRLKSCPAAAHASASGPAAEPGQSLAGEWARMKSKITASELQRNPELVEEAMELVFEIERRSNAQCGAPSGEDLALLRIAKLHQEN